MILLIRTCMKVLYLNAETQNYLMDLMKKTTTSGKSNVENPQRITLSKNQTKQKTYAYQVHSLY